MKQSEYFVIDEFYQPCKSFSVPRSGIYSLNYFSTYLIIILSPTLKISFGLTDELNKMAGFRNIIAHDYE